MVKTIKRLSLCLLMVMIVTGLAGYKIEASDLDSQTQEQIDVLVHNYMQETDLVGVAVTVVDENGGSYIKGYGYADEKNRIPVDEHTMFELGSNTKAYTALAVLKLEAEGKLNLDDKITDYIPWFSLKNAPDTGNITIRDFLYHTSGIDTSAISLISANESDDALVEQVRAFMDSPVSVPSGERFIYSNANYDCLGLIIESVTGEKYKDYMEKEILLPLNMKETVVGKENVEQNYRSGHKTGILGNYVYQAPIFGGNTPAGYIISNAQDMEKWLRFQLVLTGETTRISPALEEAVARSHQGDERVSPILEEPYQEPFQYGGGWLVFNEGKRVTHGGNNPDFSSYVIVSKEDGYAVAVMCNRNTSYAYGIASGVSGVIEGGPVTSPPADIPYLLAKVCRYFTILCIILAAIMSYLIVKKYLVLRDRYKRDKGKNKTGLYISTAVLSCLSMTVFLVPKWLFWGYPWSFILVWAPNAVIIICLELFVLLLLLILIRFIHKLKEVRRNY